MKVLSLCDGMSCGQIALTELGIKPNKYYASEIDKHAIAQTQLNFPNTIQLGNIENWQTWDIDWSSINLILAGTPCTGFSFAGKQLAFNDPQSKLFFVFVDILNHIKKHNPKVLFLLENVKMKKEYLRIISNYMGVFPTLINSALVSAQNRERYYWSNISTKQVGLFGEIHTDIAQPKDKGISLTHILTKGFTEKDKHGALLESMSRPLKSQSKMWRRYKLKGFTTLIFEDASLDWTKGVRYVSVSECARLQTIPKWYRWECSDKQTYRMLGNGWTIEVIKHILKIVA